MNEDEIETLLSAIADSGEGRFAALEQALNWCIDSRRMWRERALNAEARLHGEDYAPRDTVG